MEGTDEGLGIWGFRNAVAEIFLFGFGWNRRGEKAKTSFLQE
jgi:hypothetical protein